MKQQALFDTNIFGCLIRDYIDKLEDIPVKIKKKLVVHSYKVIRTELRKTPKKRKVGNKKLRMLLLILHDQIVEDKTLFDSKRIESLAREYHKQAKKTGNIKIPSWREIGNDLKILACGATHNIDVIFSNDLRDMFNKYISDAYAFVNLKYNLRPSNVYPYSILKEILGFK